MIFMSAPSQTYIVCTTDDQHFLLNSEFVTELVRSSRLLTTKIPKSPKCVLGAVELRGLIMPLVDMRAAIGSSPRPAEEEAAVLSLQVGDLRFALEVDEVDQVVQLSEADFEEIPAWAGAEKNRFTPKVTRHRGELLLLVDPEVLVAACRIGKLIKDVAAA